MARFAEVPGDFVRSVFHVLKRETRDLALVQCLYVCKLWREFVTETYGTGHGVFTFVPLLDCPTTRHRAVLLRNCWTKSDDTHFDFDLIYTCALCHRSVCQMCINTDCEVCSALICDDCKDEFEADSLVLCLTCT